MKTIHMLIGIPGSGKTTYGSKLQSELNCMIVSSDGIRSMHPDWPEQDVFPEVYRLCSIELNAGRDVIVDATNIDTNTRKNFCDEIRKRTVDFSVGAYLIDTDCSECYNRVVLRIILTTRGCFTLS